MTTAEAAQAALGPRYAPDDPTLPEPWKGLIDGSTGLLYYWNPDTNITQYEKPAPSPSGPAPAASTPSLAPIPVGQHGQQSLQSSQQQGNYLAQHGQMMPQQQSSQQQPSQAAQAGPQQNSQLNQVGQHSMQYQGHHSMQPQGQHSVQGQGQNSVHSQGQYPMQGQGQHPMQGQGQHPMHYQMQPQVNNSQHYAQGISQPHGSHIVQPQPQPRQFTPQNQHYTSYPPNMHTSGQQNSQQMQHSTHGHSFENQQDFKPAFSKTEELEYKNENQVGASPSKYQQRNALPVESNQSILAGISPGPSGQVPHGSVNAGQPKQFGGVQQPASSMALQQGSSYSAYQHGPSFPNQMGPGMMHGQQPSVHTVAQKMGHGDNLHGRAGNEYYYASGKESPSMGPQQPKIAPIPVSNKQQDMRMSNAPFQNVMPSGNGSGVPGHAMHSMFTPPMGGHPALSSNSLAGPPYIGSSDVSDLTPVEIYCQQHEVTATGDNVPPPFMTFDATGFPPEILREIYSAGFASPTPIQAQTWPVALQGRDIVAIAKTGSGKTLGYLMPAFMLLSQRRNNPLNGPSVLVLAPTRELATQIQDEAVKFGRSSRVSCTCLYGGAPKALQLKELDRGADIVVATPGRLNDILEMKKINFGQVSLLVLDEADRMLDMGFEPQIRKIVNEIPPRRQTLMYTATWPKEVRKIAGDLLVNPVQVNIGNVDELAANKSITQYVEFVPQMEKQRRLEQILRSQERGSKIIVFCSTKRLCDQLTRNIGRNYGAAAIHGDKSQTERDYVLNQFRSGKSPVLVATDVAARGLDIKDIRVVINYDFPTGVEDYVHRIGRTGRAGATGLSYTFFSEQDWKHASDLIKVLEGANQQVPPELRQMTSRGPPNFVKDRSGMSRFDSGDGGGGVGGRWDNGGRGGMRDGGFGGRGGMRDGGFGGRGGMRDGGFNNDGGMRDGGFGGRGSMREGGFSNDGGHGGRSDLFGGRGNRGRGFGGPRGGHSGFGRGERGPDDRFSMDGRGRGGGGGRGRGRFDNNRRDIPYRSRDRSRSRSPARVRTWDLSSRSRSRSRSWSRGSSRSRSRSRRSYSRSRSRSYSRSISPRRSRSRSRSRRSYSRSPGRGRSYERRERTNKFSDKPAEVEASNPSNNQGNQNPVLGTDYVEQVPVVGSTEPENPNSLS